MAKLSTNSYMVRERIEKRQNFDTHGALKGYMVSGMLGSFDAGRLRQADDVERFMADAHYIEYVVTSYATPIAWYASGRWYVVQQKFSVTTSRHQSQVRGLA